MKSFNERIRGEAAAVMMDADASFELRNLAYQIETVKRILSRVETELVVLRHRETERYPVVIQRNEP